MNQIEFLHGDLYPMAMKVIKKFVSTSHTRPILNYALHRENGDIVATDSHRLIEIRGIHGFKENYLVNPQTFMFAKGQFPSTEKMLNLEEHKSVLTLNKTQIKLWLQIFKSLNNTLKVMKTPDHAVRLNFYDDFIEVELKADKIKIKLPFEGYSKPDFNKIVIDAGYMRDALEAHCLLESKTINLFVKGALHPMAFDDGEFVKTLILPLRVYDEGEN